MPLLRHTLILLPQSSKLNNMAISSKLWSKVSSGNRRYHLHQMRIRHLHNTLRKIVKSRRRWLWPSLTNVWNLNFLNMSTITLLLMCKKKKWEAHISSWMLINSKKKSYFRTCKGSCPQWTPRENTLSLTLYKSLNDFYLSNKKDPRRRKMPQWVSILTSRQDQILKLSWEENNHELKS